MEDDLKELLIDLFFHDPKMENDNKINMEVNKVFRNCSTREL